MILIGIAESLQMEFIAAILVISVIFATKQVAGEKIKGIYQSYLNERRNSKELQQNIQEKIDKTYEKTQCVESKVDNLDSKVDDVARVVAIIHKDDINREAMEERLGVDDLDGDVVKDES